MPSSPTITSDATATFAAYAELATKVDDAAVADADLDEIAGAAVFNFYDTCLEQINEVCKGARALTDAGVTARFAGAPATGWNSNADHIVTGDGNSSAEGLSFWPTDAGTFNLAVRNTGTNLRGLMRFDQGAQLWSWWTNGVQRWGANNAALYPIASMTSGTDSNRWSAGYFAGTLYVADAPTTGWNGNYDDLLVGDGSGNRGVSVYGGTFGGYVFRNSSGALEAGMVSENSTNTLYFVVDGAERVRLTNNEFRPDADGGHLLGGDGKGWTALYLADGVTAPTNSSSAAIYIDSADGDLKVRFSDGTVKTIVTDT